MAADTGFVAAALPARRPDRFCCCASGLDAMRFAAVGAWLRFVGDATFAADLAGMRFADETAFEVDLAELRFADVAAFEADFAGPRLADELALEADFAGPRFVVELPFEADFAGPRFLDELPFEADFAVPRLADPVAFEADFAAVRFLDEAPFVPVFLDAVVSSAARRRALPAVRDFDVVLFGDLAISNSLRVYSYDHRLLRASGDEDHNVKLGAMCTVANHLRLVETNLHARNRLFVAGRLREILDRVR
jgi:hypothetical protein